MANVKAKKQKKAAAKPPKWFVYILECADRTLYVGSTNNLERRLHTHNHLKSGAHYTKIRRPVILKYSESLGSLGTARSREAEIKKLTRQQKLDLITSHETNL